ncbi:MAG: DUF4189 domain-containing protein [Hyphomicrobiaceae bacterium]|nr:DUF4189 domain-containing protein [Hyphomicrobiaceae bacterium]
MFGTLIRHGAAALLFLALLTIIEIRPVSAEVALAVGTTARGVARDGIAIGYAALRGEEELSRKQALGYCQSLRTAPVAARSCRIVKTLPQGCAAMALDPKPGSPGAGWSLAEDIDEAVDEAVGRCRDSSPRSRRGACKLMSLACEFDDHERTIAALTRAIALQPDTAAHYQSRGIANVYDGRFQAAAEDFDRVAALEKKTSTSIALMRHIARGRSGDEEAKADLEKRLKKLKDKSWPFAAVEFFAGKRDADELLKAAAKPEEICEAHYYIGVWNLMRGDPERAAMSLYAVTGSCPKHHVVHPAAAGELQRMGR